MTETFTQLNSTGHKLDELSYLCQSLGVEHLDMTTVASNKPALGELTERFRNRLRRAAN